VQQRLLGAVETQRALPVGANRPIHFDARVISASNISLDRLIGRGLFLPDLAARLRGMTIRVPPLSERRGDIAELAAQFVALRAKAAGYQDPPDIDAPLVDALVRARWPENVRQLHHTLECLLIIAFPDPVLTLAHCEDEFAFLRGRFRTPRGSVSVVDVERAISETGSYEAAARQLGKSLASVYRILPARTRRTGEWPAIGLKAIEDEAAP